MVVVKRSLCWLVLGLLAACARDPREIQRFVGQTMGSSYEVKFVGPQSVDAVRKVVEKELAAEDLAFSKWREDSEISRCNRQASTAPFVVSERFAKVLQQALELAAATDGAFDPTVQPLLAIYRKAKQDPAHHLDEQELQAARDRVDYRRVSVRDGAVHKARADVQLDLDGLVAGACADAIAAELDALGVPAFYLEITGEVFCRGEKAPGVPWVIGVIDPTSDAQGETDTVSELPLRDRSLCTSGDYRNGLVADGKFFHHVFDPRTGRSTDHGVVSVSVLADRAVVADGLGTALMVLGPEAGAKLLPTLKQHGALQALFLVANGDGSLRRVEVGWPAAAR